MAKKSAAVKKAESKGYNGYANHETWCVSLWLGNDEGSYRYWREKASEAREYAKENPEKYRKPSDVATCWLADALKDELEYAKPELEGMWSDLLTSALQSVEWHEIAENMLEE